MAPVDADGTWPAVAVVPANVRDRDRLDAVSAGARTRPSPREAVPYGAFAAVRCEAWCGRYGMNRRIVERAPGRKGFVVLGRRWVVERSFGWLAHWGGLMRDRTGRLAIAAARLARVGVFPGVEALINPKPVRAIAG